MPDLAITGVSEAALDILRDRAATRDQTLESYLRDLLEREARPGDFATAVRGPRDPERAKAAWENGQHARPTRSAIRPELA